MDQHVVHSLNGLPDVPHAVTIGSFDGVHCGHQHLLAHVTRRARELGVRSVAITFDPLPAEVLRPDKAPPRVCSIDERTRQILSQGVDSVVVLTFDHQLANQTAADFLGNVVQSAQPRLLVVGEDFAFGHKRQGTPEYLAQQAENYNYELDVVERVNPVDGIEWSSSFVRRKLAEDGDVNAAQAALGRAFRLSGTVQSGDHRGRDLGYPTANLDVPANHATPADGIYAAFVEIEGVRAFTELAALVYVGTRPTFGASKRIVEVYILDFNADLYGKSIAIDFVDRIRGDRAFDSAEELVQQMKVDEADGRRIFAQVKASAAGIDR